MDRRLDIWKDFLSLLLPGNRSRVEVWRDAAVSCGLQIVEISTGWMPRLKAREGTAQVWFETCADGQRTRIVVEASGPPGFDQLTVCPQLEAELMKSEIEIGDTPFDRTFYIGGPRSLVLAMLDAETRRLLTRVSSQGKLRFSFGWLRADTPHGNVAGVLPLLLDIRKRLAQPVALPRRLAANAHQDPESGVRLKNLLLLIHELPKDPATAEALRNACSDPSPQIRLRAAREMRAEGRGVLLELAEESKDDAVSAEAIALLARELPFERARGILDSALSLRHLRTAHACLEVIGRGRDAAAVDILAKVLENESGGELAPMAARALGATGSPAAEAPLIAALQRKEEDLRIAAANALGRVGSVAAVLPLQEMAGRFLLGEIRKAALQAIDRIQSRAEGASPGQLSLAGAEAGQLSLAEAEAGQLSLADDPDRS